MNIIYRCFDSTKHAPRPHLDRTFLLRYTDPGILKAAVVDVKLKTKMS